MKGLETVSSSSHAMEWNPTMRRVEVSFPWKAVDTQREIGSRAFFHQIILSLRGNFSFKPS